MLEEKIERLTAEVIKLREAIEKGGGAPAGGKAAAADTGSTGEGKAAGKAAGKGKAAAKPKFTADQVKAAVIKVKDDVSEAEAKRIISEVAGCAGLAALIAKPDVFESVMEACEEALNADNNDADDADDELGGL